ncbi:MAG: radical SAM/SPASM domain-containing protein [Planctomycetota bacterium]|jgi:MoaA/NifB/PqqE/SkfB family radical SAM enzyme
MKTKIQDDMGRLPVGVPIEVSDEAEGRIFVPDRGICIHPESVRRFLSKINSNTPLCFIPRIPVASKLGMPSFEPLIYWIPSDRGNNKSLWKRIFEAVTYKKSDAVSTSIPDNIDITTEISKEEEIYYFSDSIKIVCPKPLQVNVVVSNVCNLKCIMCPYHSPKIRDSHRTTFFKNRIWMPWELMDRIASECGELQIPVKMGNIEESLLHPKIVDFVKVCCNRGVPSVHITTNGVALTRKIARNLLQAGLTSIYISVDAARLETYKRIRGGNLSQVEKNVQTFVQFNKEMGISCKIMISLVRNRGISEAEVTEFREKWLPFTHGVIIYNLAEYEDGNSHFVNIHNITKKKMSEAGERWPCLNPWQEIYILPDHRVYYCCETISKLAFEQLESMGTYPDQGLQDIWKGDAFTALRRDLIRNDFDRWPACRDCSIWMAHVTEVVNEGDLKITRNMITEIIQCLPK